MGFGSNSVTVGQVTAMTVMTKISAGRLEYLQQVLAQPPGPIIGKISTIHFARWVIVNNGSNLLFVSEFDGSWQDYLRDFTRETPGGLDAIWGNCDDYPAGGAADFEAFSAYVSAHELHTNLFYAAYPDLTVKAILKQQRAYQRGLDFLNEFA